MGPGTILNDVRILLECVGPGGVVTKGHNASFPTEWLPELNAKMGHPVKLRLKRALLRDYPNLAGLFVLLRVMDLLGVRGKRPVLGPTATGLWQSLNPTEQYFALLEALLFRAQSSALGGEENRREAPGSEVVPVFLAQLSDRWRNFSAYDSVSLLGPRGHLPVWSVFAQQQLGLIEIRPRPFHEEERRDHGGRGWLVGGVRLTPWGEAITWGLLEFLKQEAEELAETEPGASASNEEELEVDDFPDDSPPELGFGALQPIFQPCVPAWRTVYTPARREARRGTHIFKVTLAGWRGGSGDIWRRLAVPPDISLDGLAGAILAAFKLDEDHAYDFRYRDQRG